MDGERGAGGRTALSGSLNKRGNGRASGKGVLCQRPGMVTELLSFSS